MDGSFTHLHQGIAVDGACSAPLHLFKIVDTFHIAHKKQHFQGFHIGSRGNHINGYSNSWIIRIPKPVQKRFRIFVDFISYFFTKFIAFVELLTYYFYGIIGMAVGLGKDECFRYFVIAFFIHPVGEDLCLQSLAEFPDDISDLAWVYHFFIQIVFGVFYIFIFLLPAYFVCQLIATVNEPTRFYHIAFLGYISFDGVHIIRHIYAIGNRLFITILAYHVFVEEAKSAFVGRGG